MKTTKMAEVDAQHTKYGDIGIEGSMVKVVSWNSD